jgi:hypothetical protein
LALYMKNCNKCLEKKELGEFNKYMKSKDGHYPTCRTCRNKERFEGGHNRNYPRPPAYWTWVELRRRCDRPKPREVKYYGGRGITYEPKWSTYEGFWEDMGSSHKKGLSLDRTNTNGNYTKENCRWATAKEQAQTSNPRGYYDRL